MKNRYAVWSVAISAAFIVRVGTAHADRSTYTIVELPTLGGTESFGYAINDHGDIVGSSRNAGDTTSVPFLYRKRSITSLAPLNTGDVLTTGPTDINKFGQVASGVVRDGIYSAAIYDTRDGRITSLGSLGGVTSYGFSGVALSINDRGDAVGYSYVDGSNRHAFVYRNGIMNDLGSFGGYSAAVGINNKGEIVGFSSETVSGTAHAFVADDDAMREINPFNAQRNESYAEAINNRGQIVGVGLLPSGAAFNGFIYHKGSSANIGTLPGGRYSEAVAINDHGDVVGLADEPYDDLCPNIMGLSVPCVKYAQRAFLYKDGEMTTLNSLLPRESGWDLSWAFDINDRGQITGYGMRNGKFRTYVMTPVNGNKDLPPQR